MINPYSSHRRFLDTVHAGTPTPSAFDFSGGFNSAKKLYYNPLTMQTGLANITVTMTSTTNVIETTTVPTTPLLGENGGVCIYGDGGSSGKYYVYADVTITPQSGQIYFFGVGFAGLVGNEYKHVIASHRLNSTTSTIDFQSARLGITGPTISYLGGTAVYNSTAVTGSVRLLVALDLAAGTGILAYKANVGSDSRYVENLPNRIAGGVPIGAVSTGQFGVTVFCEGTNDSSQAGAGTCVVELLSSGVATDFPSIDLTGYTPVTTLI